MTLNISEIYDKHRELIHRAPSPHNTQPWLVKLGGDKLTITYDSSRVLHVTDPIFRDLYLCLGMFIESIAVVVGGESGFDIDLYFDTDTDIDIESDLNNISKTDSNAGKFSSCTISISSKLYPKTLTSSDLSNRSTNRKVFAVTNITKSIKDITDILTYVDDQKVESNVEHKIIRCSKDIADLLDKADLIQMSDTDSSVELNYWLRAERKLLARDGLSSIVLDLKFFEARFLKILFSRPIHSVLKYLGLAKILVKSRLNTLTNDTILVAFTLKKYGNPRDIIDTGRYLFCSWSLLCRSDYSVHPMSQLLDVVKVKSELEKILCVNTSSEVVFVVRTGFSDTHSGRSLRLV
ncbi:MAG: hypothetical protein KBF89_05055 [Acidimicrobiia bacterium]|nr:hypothetical protein [Acidimicrobiia bacterium]